MTGPGASTGSWSQHAQVRTLGPTQTLSDLQRYANQFTNLTPEQERACAEGVAAGDPQATRTLFDHNLRLVFHIARRSGEDRLKRVEMEDLVQYGCIGLLRAIRSFDPERARFTTYATMWIRKMIANGVDEDGYLVKVPVFSRERMRPIIRERRRLRDRLRRDPTLAELSAACGKQVTAADLETCDAIEGADQVSGIVDFDDDEAPGSIARDDSFEDDVIDDLDLASLTRDLLWRLPERRRRAISLHLGIGADRHMNYTQVGSALGVSRQVAREEIKAGLLTLAAITDRDTSLRHQLQSLLAS